MPKPESTQTPESTLKPGAAEKPGPGVQIADALPAPAAVADRPGATSMPGIGAQTDAVQAPDAAAQWGGAVGHGPKDVRTPAASVQMSEVSQERGIAEQASDAAPAADAAAQKAGAAVQKPGATIQAVARAAGVSPASVSRFLNGHLVLPEATARRIRAAVLELGYRPNAIARRLRSGSSETLGLITADIAYPLFATIASAAEAEATAAGYSLVMFNSRNRAESEIGFLSRVEDRQLDGVLLLTNHIDDGALAARINACRAVVLLDEDVPGAAAPRLFADNEAGGLAAGRHLIAAGHRRIAHVTGPVGLLSVDERRRGFETALAEAGLSLDPALLASGRYDEGFGAEAFERLFALPEPPTAVFAAADMLAIGMIRAARAAGVAVPRDLSIVGYDDIPLASLLDPPLTTIRQSAEAFGRLGVRLLVDLVRGEREPARPERIAVELVVRGSVDRPRAGTVETVETEVAAPAR